MDAYEQGYRVRGEKVIKLSTGKEHSLQLLNNKGYRLYRFSITLSNTKNRRRSVFVHQLLAYQKYGMSAFLWAALHPPCFLGWPLPIFSGGSPLMARDCTMVTFSNF